MAALRTTIVEEEQLYKVAISNGQPAVVTVVAFRGNVTSPPMYIRSNDADVTSDTGIVSKLGLIISLGRLVYSVHLFVLLLKHDGAHSMIHDTELLILNTMIWF